MLKIALIGGGSHSRGNHLPALKHYDAQHPGEIAWAAFCDRDPAALSRTCEKYPFQQSYTDVTEMLEKEDLDGCIAVTPTQVTAEIAAQVIEKGIPLLMEKPPGRTVEEARAICQLVEKNQARVMVSVNRRFEPQLTAALQWQDKRPLTYIRATMLRHARAEKDFLVETGIHALDTLRMIAGDIREHRVESFFAEGTLWYTIYFTFCSGAHGLLEVMPTSGCVAETYDLFGPEYRCLIRSGYADTGSVQAWENNQMAWQYQTPAGTDSWIRNGTYAETVEFISSIQASRAPHPTPSDILQTVELTHQMMTEAYQAHQTCRPSL
jgi:predicted dehydrogenase